MTFNAIIHAIFLGPLELLFEVLFVFAYKLTNHPGLSIVVLSFAVNMILLPLNMRADAIQKEEREDRKSVV